MDLEIRTRLRDVVTRRLRTKGDLEPLNDEDRLFQNDRLDSLDAVEIIMSVEEDYGIDFSKINYFDMTLLDLVAEITALLGARTARV